MSPLVSICIPVFNAEKWLNECLQSVKRQTYPNIEIVVVDDGSTDNSLALLDDSVRVIRQAQNMGLVYTRRHSIEEAKGEYILCVDADDYLEPEAVDILVKKALDTQADIVDSAIEEHWANRSRTLPPYRPQSEDYLEDVLRDRICHLCAKLIRRSFMMEHDCWAPQDFPSYLEDRIVLLRAALYSPRVASVEQVTYHYMHRSADSLTVSKTQAHFDALARYWQEADKLLQENGLAERYAKVCGRQKTEDKAVLMLHVADNKVRKNNRELFAAEEKKYAKYLSSGLRWCSRLVGWRLWPLLSIWDAVRRK